MTEHFTSNLLFLVFVLLIGAILGYIIGLLFRKSIKFKENEVDFLKQRILSLEEELSASKEGNIKLQEEVDALKLLIGKLETSIRKKSETLKAVEPVAAAVIPEVREKAINSQPGQDDLRIILGIGPKISRLLNKRGINTWKQLSEADPVLIREYLLHDGGERYRIHNPSTWPHQAKLADEGRWEELKDYQDKLQV